MSRILTQNLVPGMITAEDVYSYNNQLIIAKDTPLTDKAITKLEFYSVLSIRIKDDQENVDVEIPYQVDPDAIYSDKVKNSPEFKRFKKEFNESLLSFKDSVNDLILKQKIDTESLLEKTNAMLGNNPTGIHVFDMLHNMREFDDPTYAHCLNVALICNVFGKWLGMPAEEVRLLTLCGMLHDVGKLRIPENIISHPGKLSDEEYSIIKTHALEGFNILKNLDLNDHIKNCALMHHERCDGSGYPFGLTSNKIDRYAKIVAIADVYDAMTSPRVYRSQLCPFKVIEIFESEGLQKYDPEFILVFLEYVVNTYMNNRVRLSNGLEGDVVLINKLCLARPMIRCGNHYIDLSRDKKISIEAII